MVYKALIPMKNGETKLQPGELVDTSGWDDETLRRCLEHRWIAEVRDDQPVAKPIKPVVAEQAGAQEATPRRKRGRPKGSKNKKTLAREAAQAAANTTHRPESEAEAQAERLRVAKVGLRAAELEREQQGTIDITDDPV